MKAKIIIAFLANFFVASNAQEQNSSNNAKREILAYRFNILGASREPYRKAGEKTYDLTPLFDYMKRLVDDPDFAKSARRPEEYDNWSVVFGTVLQILDDDGILLKKYQSPDFVGDWQTVRLKNFPRGKSLVDGKKLAVFAYFDGRYSYSNTGGARSTVESYDYGKIPSEDEVRELKAEADKRLKARLQQWDEQRRSVLKAEEARRASGKQAALRFWQAKAEAGDGYAQMRLGEIYFRGDGVETNTDLVRKWWSLARTNGYPQVTNLLFEIERNTHPK
jgi:TPR repeat protein